MKKIYSLLNKAIRKIQRKAQPHCPNVDPSAYIGNNVTIKTPDTVFMEENTNIYDNSYISGAFTMKKNSGAAEGLTVIAGNHMSVVGLNLKQVTEEMKEKLDINNEYSAEIVVEEDVWIGMNVTLLQGVRLGRGCEVGAGSVVRNSIPPYSIVIGNPCKIVGFRFTPEEIIEHEKAVYDEADRLPLELLQKNYEKYFINRLKEIKQFTKL